MTAESRVNTQPHDLDINTIERRESIRAVRTGTMGEVSFVWESVREEIIELSVEGEIVHEEMR